MNALDWIAVGIIALVLGWALRILYVAHRERRWALMAQGCDRTVSGESNACEGRWHDLPAYVVRHLRESEHPVHVCAKCGRPILVEVGWREEPPSSSRWN